ncbi:MAG TPA: hypothetical protein VK473_19965 [Terriglobales bacterium]|nr:hypothetical protein [Terriglobales bacterium]
MVAVVRCALLLLAVVLATAPLLGEASVEAPVPPGTVLPVMLRTSIHSRKTKPGQPIVARVMEDVPLPNGRKVPSGAKLAGHVVSLAPRVGEVPSSITLEFDRILVKHREIPVVTSLRAIASFMEVSDAYIPMFGPERLSVAATWQPRKIGSDKNSLLKCGVSADKRAEDIWVFYPTACGTFGLGKGVEIVRNGQQRPKGRISLTSEKKDLNLVGGAGLLLRVEEVTSPTEP